MAHSWHMRGEKQSEHLGVIWQFDLQSRTLSVAFAILSVTQQVNEVKRAVATAFGMSEFAPAMDFVLPADTPALRFILDSLDKAESILNSREIGFLRLLTFF